MIRAASSCGALQVRPPSSERAKRMLVPWLSARGVMLSSRGPACQVRYTSSRPASAIDVEIWIVP